MKIAFLTEDIFGLGGVQRVITTLANALVENNDVSVICINKSTKIDRSIYQLDDRVNILNPRELHQINRGQYFKKGLRYINKRSLGIKNTKFLEFIYITQKDKKAMIDFFQHNSFDVIVAAQLKLSMLLGAVADSIKPKCYGWQHNTFDAYFNTPHNYYWNQNNLARKYLSKLKGCVILSKEDEDKYLNLLGLKVKCIYNPVAILTKKTQQAYKKQFNKTRRILFVSRLIREQKGLDYLIDIIRKCIGYNYVFHIIGDGNDRGYLEEQLKKNVLNHKAKVHGYVKNVQKYYGEADLLISTSRWEGFGLTLVEAMQFGVPVVAFDNSGPTEIIGTSGAGIIVPKYDVKCFVESINLILNNEEKYMNYSNAALIRFQDFMPAVIAEKWLEFIDTEDDMEADI